MNWVRVSRYALRSGKWLIAKHGGGASKYLLTHDDQPRALMWFNDAEAAKEAARRLDLARTHKEEE